MLWQAITVLEAQETMTAAYVSMWPHLEQSAREKHHKQLHETAFPGVYKREKKYITPEELQAYLAGR